MACSDPSHDELHSWEPSRCWGEHGLQTWSYLFSLRTSYFIGVSLNVSIAKVSVIVVPPLEVCWKDCNEVLGVNAENTVCT